MKEGAFFHIEGKMWMVQRKLNISMDQNSCPNDTEYHQHHLIILKSKFMMSCGILTTKHAQALTSEEGCFTRHIGIM